MQRIRNEKELAALRREVEASRELSTQLEDQLLRLLDGGDGKIGELKALEDDLASAVQFPAQTLGPGAYATQDCDGTIVPIKLGSDEELWIYRNSDSALSDGVDWNEGDSPKGESYARKPDVFGAFVMGETLRRSSLSGLDTGARVNLELPLQPQSRRCDSIRLSAPDWRGRTTRTCRRPPRRR